MTSAEPITVTIREHSGRAIVRILHSLRRYRRIALHAAKTRARQESRKKGRL